MGSHTESRRCNAAHADDQYFARHNHTKSPVVVQWMATLRCGLDCAHCMTSGTKGEISREMSLDLSLSLIDQVAHLGVEELLISGGEPLDREDLPSVIAHLGRRGVRYSLNTARMPGRRLRSAFERSRPSYVAVSLDGPEKIHDTFRGQGGAFSEALEAIEYFTRLGAHVAAGTTITRKNIGYLNETFTQVSKSSARSWGIHLLVPEGRARQRRDLFPSKRELRWLLGYIADKRNYFPVELADELGYCGDLEPLVRDLPMTCGAGRTQCVVLPTGDVVPCTTLDLSTSAGNLVERSLADIWTHGFVELRQNRPKGSCRSCEYFSACGGGCWLQRRASSGCFKEVWSPHRVVATAASFAVALGLSASLSCSARRQSQATTTDGAAVEDVATQDDPESDGDRWTQFTEVSCSDASTPPSWQNASDGSAGPFHGVPIERSPPYTVGTSLDTAILFWTMGDLPGHTVFDVEALSEEQRNDPAWIFYQAMVGGALPSTLEGRSLAIREALCTRDRSLSFSAAMWRSMTEALLDGPSPVQRSAQDQEHVRDSMLNFAVITAQWRQEVFQRRLDPYLATGRRHRPWAAGWRLKSAPPRPPLWFGVSRDLAEERWGPPQPRPRDDQHQSQENEQRLEAEEQAVALWLEEHPLAEGLHLTLSSSRPGLVVLRPSGRVPVEEANGFGVFDILAIEPGTGTVRLSVSCRGVEQPFSLEAREGVQLAYGDVLRLVYEQNRAAIDALAQPIIEGRARSRVEETAPLLLPAIRARASSNAARHWLVDFWLY